MRHYPSVVDLIGDTPLVQLRRLAVGLRPTVLAKLESFNPGGSAKDRIAVRMIADAEDRGLLRPGSTIVEPTSGNTGVGLALVAQQRGYRCVFTCPDKVSADKIAVLRAYGAEVVICPAAVPPDHPDSYRAVSARLAAEIPGAYRPDQYSNPANPESHYRTTGPEIWTGTGGTVTHLVAGVGTGGTISGAGRYLKEVSGGAVRVIGADPVGSVYSGGTGRPYLVEGVGQPTVPATYDPGVADRVLGIPDARSVAVTRRLALEEGILTGGSGGMAVAAALDVARDCGPDDVLVTVVPDSGRGYLSKIFDLDWLRRLGLDSAGDGRPRFGDLPADAPGLALAGPRETVGAAVARMRGSGRRHLVVTAAAPPVRLPEVLGLADLGWLGERLARGLAAPDDPVADHLAPVPPLVGAGQPVEDGMAALSAAGAALVMDGGLPCRLVTPEDVAAHLGAPCPKGPGR